MAAAIDLLILDVNDVMYRYDTARRVELLAELTGTTSGAVRLALFESGVEDRSDSGQLTADEYLAAIGERLGRSIDRSMWTRASAGAVTPMEDSIALIRRIRPLVETVGLSNNGLLMKERAQQIFPTLDELDIELHVSAEFGGQKPKARVFQGLCDLRNVEPARAAFVDDRAANADGAAAAGLLAHHFTTVGSLRTFLLTLGLPV